MRDIGGRMGVVQVEVNAPLAYDPVEGRSRVEVLVLC